MEPFKTDNPKEIPDDHKITLNKVGQQVKTGEFGNEGSGGQSYMKYNWAQVRLINSYSRVSQIIKEIRITQHGSSPLKANNGNLLQAGKDHKPILT